ncbi:MAG TPA: dTMP kinase [Candidatus Paceibacterota bacterium]
MPFMILEGGEGSGKDTQIALLKKRLDTERTVFTREPGGTVVGEKLRSIVLSTEMQPETEMLIFLAARAELVRTVIRPALNAGKLVISNRFGLSTIAYQIYGRERPHLMPFLEEISKQVLGDIESPHCILLDVSPEIGLKRVEGRNDGKTRFDAELYAFHDRVRQGYLEHYNDNGRGIVIDANAPEKLVTRQIAEQMKKWGIWNGGTK